MKKRILSLYGVLVFALVIGLMSSCKKENIDKVEIDNQFAVSVFSDTVKISDLLNGLDSVVSDYVKVREDGTIYAYYSDSVKNAVVAEDILSGLDDIYFEVEKVEFEIPEFPNIPDLPNFELDTSFYIEGIKVPFEYEGYEINEVILKNGKIIMDLVCDMEYVTDVVLSTDNIKLSNGENLVVSVNLENGSHHLELDLTNCSISPPEGSIDFTVMITIKVQLQDLESGTYVFDMSGSITDIEFKSIDGTIQDTKFEFEGVEPLSLEFPNLYGDLKIATPEFSIKYVNSFGFAADGYIDSLYLTDVSGNKIPIIKDWEQVELSLHSTHGQYDSITDLDDALVDEIDLLNDYSSITFLGNVVLGCDNVTDNMISEDSHIDIIADLELPLEFNIDELMYLDTIDFDLNLGSEDGADDENIHVEDIFDELEFKFVFNNGLPLQIQPQAYMIENNQIIDSLFVENACIHANNHGEITEDVIIAHITDERLINVQKSDQILLCIRVSSLGENVVINSNDYFHLRIGLKTKTTEIYLEDVNF